MAPILRQSHEILFITGCCAFKHCHFHRRPSGA